LYQIIIMLCFRGIAVYFQSGTKIGTASAPKLPFLGRHDKNRLGKSGHICSEDQSGWCLPVGAERSAAGISILKKRAAPLTGY